MYDLTHKKFMSDTENKKIYSIKNSSKTTSQ